MADVHVRIGAHREVYHTDPDCPALNGKQETYLGQETLSEERARQRRLRACQRCRK